MVYIDFIIRLSNTKRKGARPQFTNFKTVQTNKILYLIEDTISRICNVYVHKNWLTFYVKYVKIARCINICLYRIRKAYMIVYLQDIKCKEMMFTTKSGNII